LPLTVVEAQNFAESGYGSNNGPSSAGALGPWQFMPATWSGLGFPPGKENDWTISTQAYVKYMDELLKQEGGSVFKALEAYNAGPGNLSAGAGYASGILSSAGVPQNSTAQPGSAPAATPVTATAGFDPSGFLSGLIGGLFGSTGGLSLGVSNLKDLSQRLGLIILGAGLIYVGILIISRDFAGAAGIIPQKQSVSQESSLTSDFRESAATADSEIPEPAIDTNITPALRMAARA
jgi:hypothetical protein